MKFRVVAIIICALCLSACARPATKKNALHKAALLNVAMGQKYLQQMQIDLSKQKLVHALELAPKSPEAHTAMAYLYEVIGDLKEAELHHTKAIRYGAGNGSFYNNYGTFLCRQGRLQEADRAYHAALRDKKYTRTSDVYENAAVCALKQKDFVKAREYFKSAVKHNPKLKLKHYDE